MINLLIRQSMLRMEKNIRKVLVIDEAWSILANPSGMALVESTTRLGRSFNLSVVLATQNYSEIFNDTNNLNTSLASTHFAFNNSEEDAAIGAKAMGLKGDNAEQAIDAITKLDQGECFMQDIRKRRGLVYVEIWLPDLPEIFDSNPLRHQRLTLTTTRKQHDYAAEQYGTAVPHLHQRLRAVLQPKEP